MDRQKMIDAIVEQRKATYRMTDDQVTTLRQSLGYALPAEPMPVADPPLTLPADNIYAVAARGGYAVGARKTPEQLTAVKSGDGWVSADPEFAQRSADHEQMKRDAWAAWDKAHPPTHMGVAIMRTIAAPGE